MYINESEPVGNDFGSTYESPVKTNAGRLTSLAARSFAEALDVMKNETKYSLSEQELFFDLLESQLHSPNVSPCQMHDILDALSFHARIVCFDYHHVYSLELKKKYWKWLEQQQNSPQLDDKQKQDIRGFLRHNRLDLR
jgi:hypothetical protein